MSDGWTPESSSSRKVPYQVQQLARMVAYAFYGKEHGLIVDILCKHSSVKEDDLCEILKLEKKHFRNILQALKGDQIIASKQRITKDASDVSQRSFEYGLEFSSLLNMVKYKLDLMRRKLETEERNNSNRASFSCLDCKKTFSDLEAGLLFDHLTGGMACTICGSEVEEAPAAMEQSQQVRMAQFNECLSPFFDLIHEIDALDLSPNDLRSDFSESAFSLARADAQSGGEGNWSSDRTRGDYNYIPQAITINIGEAEVKPQKARQQPVWLSQSTVMPDAPPGLLADAASDAKSEEKPGSGKDDQVLSMLMKHEKKIYEEDDRPPASPPSDDTMDDSMDEVDQQDDAISGPTVVVGGVHYSLDQVNDDLVGQMTEEEKDAYIEIAQKAYADLYA